MNDRPVRRKILNPYKNTKDYNCFGCSPNNLHGLQMEFFEEGDLIISEWKPAGYLSGYKNVLHGGIQSTLMDELASWTVQIKLKTAGVTASLFVKYKKPVYTTDDKIILKASVEKQIKRLAFIKTELFNSKGDLCSTGEIKYFTYPEKLAREKLFFPEYESFFE